MKFCECGAKPWIEPSERRTVYFILRYTINKIGGSDNYFVAWYPLCLDEDSAGYVAKKTDEICLMLLGIKANCQCRRPDVDFR